MPATHTFTTEDIEYLRHGDLGLSLTVYKPSGAPNGATGPFPAVIDLHGGAWSASKRDSCKARDEVLASRGIVAIALDFRDGAHGYPSALVDINYAIRWAKANAAKLNTRPDWISLSGQSSGGHLAMLVAMRPDDPRYAAIALPAGSPAVDATVRSIVMTWPVINPRSRYYHLQRARAAGTIPEQYKDIAERQTTFWKNDENMIEGNPMLILEKGEKVLTPPTLWVQSRPDFMHDYRDNESPVALNEPERFVANYRKAGGRIEIKDIGANEREALSTHEMVADYITAQQPGIAAAAQ